MLYHFANVKKKISLRAHRIPFALGPLGSPQWVLYPTRYRTYRVSLQKKRPQRGTVNPSLFFRFRMHTPNRAQTSADTEGTGHTTWRGARALARHPNHAADERGGGRRRGGRAGRRGGMAAVCRALASLPCCARSSAAVPPS
jgi:hypothetical protein